MYEYLHVTLPPHLQNRAPKKHLMTEDEWRRLGIDPSPGWELYMVSSSRPLFPPSGHCILILILTLFITEISPRTTCVAVSSTTGGSSSESIESSAAANPHRVVLRAMKMKKKRCDYMAWKICNKIEFFPYNKTKAFSRLVVIFQMFLSYTSTSEFYHCSKTHLITFSISFLPESILEEYD